MNFTLSGTVHSISETQKFARDFSKRDLVLNTGGQYPQFIKLEGQTTMCPKMDELVPGQTVDIEFRIRGKQATNGSYYNTLLIKGWVIKGAAPATDIPASSAAAVSPSPVPPPPAMNPDEDVPF
jgi:hypothetical protein